MSDTGHATRSPSARVSINGDKVRGIRESKGLTQLYIATELGVTTDTVSRWENRRYPTIKWENAEKLARALEADVLEILDEPVEAGEAGSKDSATGPRSGRRQAMIAILAAVPVLAVAAWMLTVLLPARPADIVATRFLPQHAPAGQPFPVIIKVESGSDNPFSFILQEKLPAGCTAVKGEPPFIGSRDAGRRIKWIGNSSRSPHYLAYLVKVAPSAVGAATLDFTGFIKIDRMPDSVQQIIGSSTVRISNYHWADSNEDGRIDDVEILAIYNSFEALQNLGVDLQLIKNIWSGKGYRWDPGNRTYSVIGQ